MYKVVYDTNIYISGIFWSKGNPRKTLLLAEAKTVLVYTSLFILQELDKVLLVDFKLSKEEADEIIKHILTYTTVIEPAKNIDVIKTHSPDNIILGCAIGARANYIVSGDKHLLDLGEYEGIKILTPKGFLEEMER